MSLTAAAAKLAAAKSIVFSGSAAGLLAFIISESLTGSAILAVCLSAICSVAVALIRSRPHIISAHSQAQALAATEWAKLFNQAAALHAETLSQANAINADQLLRLREKNERLEKKRELMVVSKHNIGGAYQAAVWHIQGLHELLRAHKIEFPSFDPETIKQLTADEDRETLALFGMKSASEKIA